MGINIFETIAITNFETDNRVLLYKVFFAYVLRQGTKLRRYESFKLLCRLFVYSEDRVLFDEKLDNLLPFYISIFISLIKRKMEVKI